MTKGYDTPPPSAPQDVGKSILESYSRVLESLASNITSRIEDVIHVDNQARGAVGRSVPESPFTSNRFALNIPSIATAISVASTEDMVPELWQDSPLHSPSRTQTPTSPLSVKSESSFRDKLWKRKPPGLPQPQMPNSPLKAGSLEAGPLGGAGKKSGGSGSGSRSSSLFRSQSDSAGAL